jgi:hypothetical protein
MRKGGKMELIAKQVSPLWRWRLDNLSDADWARGRDEVNRMGQGELTKWLALGERIEATYPDLNRQEAAYIALRTRDQGGPDPHLFTKVRREMGMVASTAA